MKNKFYIYLITLFLFSCSESQVNIKDLNKNAGLYYYEEKPLKGRLESLVRVTIGKVRDW